MINITNLTAKSIDEVFLKKIARRVLKEEGSQEVELSIVLIGPGKMKKLNKKYRGKNRATDVLAFGQGQNLKQKNQKSKFIIPSELERDIGEVVICLREVKKNAKRFNFAFETELARVLIHGILHLLGYNHEKSEVEAKRMQKKQNYYLSQILK